MKTVPFDTSDHTSIIKPQEATDLEDYESNVALVSTVLIICIVIVSFVLFRKLSRKKVAPIIDYDECW